MKPFKQVKQAAPNLLLSLAGADGHLVSPAPGSRYLENRIGTPMVYYAVDDRQSHWRIQHL